MKTQPSFFDFAAEVGLTKHIGGVAATETLIRLCHVGKDSYVLDVGCGVGHTACFIAQKFGCRVMGVDIRQKMVERSTQRTQRQKLTGQVEFRVADAQDLPFADGTFDAVITESVTAFPPDKQQAVNEYARVTRPGGYVGLNETTWLKSPPPPEIVAWAEQDVGASVKPLTADEWTTLLRNATLTIRETRVLPVDLRVESQGLLQRYGFWGMLGVMSRMLALYTRSPDYRRFVKSVGKGGVTPPHLEEYFGYGLFVAQK